MWKRKRYLKQIHMQVITEKDFNKIEVIRRIRMGGRREEGSGWGTQVYLWRTHFDIWQN